MFKLESYITPILLSYVDKYIKNFRPEDSQVSLWGGDASFHNLDLRLEVLEQELQLPFSFVSGHIHELLIHVPWTKLASEPITITINTIECILKLRGAESSAASDSSSHAKDRQRKMIKRQEVEAPPGYVQSLVNKIVSNIKIFCNNLILKYVEEDIVVSMNVKLLMFESANEKWEPAYTAQVTLRKLITVSDLTMCLDKRNAAGKIDVYQEPVLYRCSLTMHMLRHYHSATAKRASTTRLDIYCNSMEFSMTEQQVPMLMRIVMLLLALQQKQLRPDVEASNENPNVASEHGETTESSESWAGWAWSFVPSILPVSWDEDWNREQQMAASGHTIQIGFYVDNASLTFKVSESTSDRGYYAQRKLKYWPLLTLRLQGIFVEMVMHGLSWFQSTFGISHAELLPVGYCSCTYSEVVDGVSPPEYFRAGLVSMNHKTDSLFDAEAMENKGQKKAYNTSWDYHVTIASEGALLERTSAFALDYLYQLEVPDDMSSERLSEIGSDLEYSNLSERALLRIVVGPLRLRLCSGFFHRIGSLRVAASTYDYPPYSVPKPHPPLSELPPPCAEDFDALTDNIPTRSVQFTIFAPVIELQLMDHPYFKASKGHLFRTRRKTSNVKPPSPQPQRELPKLTLECQCIDAKIQNPMYIKRLVQTVCQLPDPPVRMFKACHTKTSIKVIGICSRLVLTPNRQTTIITPSSASYNSKCILIPQYWVHPDIPHERVTFECESVAVTGTKAKILIVAHILDKFIKMDEHDSINSILNTSLIQDAVKDFGMAYLELCVEGLRWKKVQTVSTVTVDASLGSIKAFIYEPVDVTGETKRPTVSTLTSFSYEMMPRQRPTSYNTREIQQVLVISGPETTAEEKTKRSSPVWNGEERPLFSATVQYPLKPTEQPHAPILVFNLQEIRISIDPLFCSWLSYNPRQFQTHTEVYVDPLKLRNRNVSEASGSLQETPRRVGTPLESIHSSSDREHVYIPAMKPKHGTSQESADVQEQIYDFLNKWFDVWKGLMLCGDIAQCTIYFPLNSLSAIGSQGIQQAVNEELKKKDPSEIMVFTLPNVTIRSAAQRHNLSKYVVVMPVKLPDSVWTSNKSSFPWTVTLSDLSCYTLQYGVKLNFLKPLTLEATIGLSTKPARSESKDPIANVKDTGSKSSKIPKTGDNYSTQHSDLLPDIDKNEIGSLGVCIHIDMSPINISISEIQVCLMASVLFGLMDVLSNLFPEKPKTTLKTPEIIPNLSGWSPTMSPTLMKESTLDSISEKTPPITMGDVSQGDSVKLTAWVQWTIARFTIELLSYHAKDLDNPKFVYLNHPKLKLVIDAEDIVSSLDFQSVYLKIKSKIATATIRHFKREKHSDHWQPGAFLGLVMRGRDDVNNIERQEDTGFATLTITRASCQHTHALWGAVRKSKDSKFDHSNTLFQTPSRQITEILIVLQPVDYVISLTTLRSFLLVLEPLIKTSMTSLKQSNENNYLLQLNNNNLPLIYFECRGIRVIMPSSELGTKGAIHNVYMFQVECVNITPSAVNPICRSPCRPDIYQQAAHARILNVPGSEVEDRQYQLDVVGMGIHTGTWVELDPILNKHGHTSNLKTMNENPALEWNNLKEGKLSITPHLSLWPVIRKFSLSIIAAPAMVYKKDTLICGHSIEVNCTSDIDINISLGQIQLASSLLAELMFIFEPFFVDSKVSKRPQILVSYHTIFEGKQSRFEEEEFSAYDATKDSGIETSELRSTFSMKSRKDSVGSAGAPVDRSILKNTNSDRSFGVFPRPPNPIPCSYNNIPIEVLLVGGKVTLLLYQSVNQNEKDTLNSKNLKSKFRHSPRSDTGETGYEGSEEGSIDEKPFKKMKDFQPLVYLLVVQPNVFFSRYQISKKLQVSCFDVCMKISGPEYSPLKSVPCEGDFAISLLETRPGIPNPDTGISPAFFTLKLTRGIGKPASLAVEIGRPTRILCSITRWNYLMIIKDKFISSMTSSFEDLTLSRSSLFSSATKPPTVIDHNYTGSHAGTETYSKFKEIKNQLHGIAVWNLKLAQMVFAVKTDSGPEVNLSIGKLENRLTMSNRPERLTNVVTFENLTLGVSKDGFTRLLLNPWTATIEVCLFWDSWQNMYSDPQIQVSAETDCIVVDISPQQIKCVEMVVKEITDFFSNVNTNVSTSFGDTCTRATSISEVNLFHSDKEQYYKDDLRAGAFQFVDANTNNTEELPLPYQVMFWNQKIGVMAWRYPQPRALTKVRIFPVPYKISSDGHCDQQIIGHLEYWSDCHGCYRAYSQFQLSESEVQHLQLPHNSPPIVACTWRVVLSSLQSNTEAREYGRLPVLISPRALAACMRIDSYFNKNLVPDLTFVVEIGSINISLYNHFNKSLEIVMPDFLSSFTSDLDVPETQCFLTLSFISTKAYLASWNFDSATFDISTTTKCSVLDYAFLTDQTFIEPFSAKLEVSMSKNLTVNFISKPINFKFGPSMGHTFAVSAQMWEQSWKNKSGQETRTELIVMTCYIICNDTGINLRFGQAGTDEDVLLPSRYCHLYCWRSQKIRQTLRVGLEENGWVWSKPFQIDQEGTEICQVSPENNCCVVVTINNVSATQKQIIFSGQLIICNMLLEHFELKVVALVKENKDKEFKRTPSHILAGKSVPPSLLINTDKRFSLRIRFFGLEAAWSGDIPLEENAKCAQPWLVKVPLHERGQFLSIWCRIVVQQFPNGAKILAMLWPLFMVRSNLPVSSKVHIETPTLGVRLESIVEGRGEYQQLYCPGTIDHSHQLTFQLESGTPTSNPYVPLNYSLVDQKQFFKKPEKEDINDILQVINNFSKPKWPFFGDELDEIEWISEDQPLTHVQVRYQNACLYSSALLVELLPWCLLVNTLGCSIGIIANAKELCRICHHGIVTPPKLEETFHICVRIGGSRNNSLPLQLSKSDWSQTFYMPTITGTIPLEGNIKTLVKCGSQHICMVSITSSVINEIRLLKVSSTHILTNYMSMQLHVVCIAVPDDEDMYNMPRHMEKHSFTIAPHMQKSNSGISIIQWYTLGNEIDSNTDFALYLALSAHPKLGWSCPIRVDKGLSRRNVSVNMIGQSVPVVITSQEYKGQICLSLHHDLHPQLLIENKTGTKLFCSQHAGSETNLTVADCQHFRWLHTIASHSSEYYSMPTYSEKFPDISHTAFVEKLVLAADPEGDPVGFQWSTPVNVTNYNDQFVRVPFFGDVKVTIINSIHATIVVVDSISQIEVSAKDIRVRLSMHENEKLKKGELLNELLESTSSTSVMTTYISAKESPLSLVNNAGTSYPRGQYGIQTLPPLLEHSSISNMTDSIASKSMISQSLVSPLHFMGKNWANIKAVAFLKELTLTLIDDLNNTMAEKTEIVSITCEDIVVIASHSDVMEVTLSISAMQFDNQLYYRGGFDFPVVLGGQEQKSSQNLKTLNTSIMQWVNAAQEGALITCLFNLETWRDMVQDRNVTEIKDVKVNVEPLSTYIEDIYVTKLMEYLSVFIPTNLVLWPKRPQHIMHNVSSVSVGIPDYIRWESIVLARPLTLRSLSVEPLSVLLSVHSSIKMYIALDQSPLQFGRFERKRLVTIPYRLGHALTMHYLSGAIFGAGWVVGSLELLGSPGGLARAMGTGLRDFVSLPYRGLLQGPWAFLRGVTHGSASLMKHVTAGTLQSVTKLASSVARNLDRLTLDEEHLRRTEEQRRQRPQGLAQGFIQGLTGLGISLLGAVGGIAHHPLQSVMAEGASPRGLAAGVGLGLVGVITKPLSGAADLVALTGQGLLQGAGWNPHPEPRKKPSLHHIFSSPNSILKYNWKFMQAVTQHNLLFVTEATYITNIGQYEAVALILTLDALIIINTDEDTTQRVVRLTELNAVDNTNDPTLLCFKLITTVTPFVSQNECAVDMDPAFRARIADYVRSTAGLILLPEDISPDPSEMSVSPSPNESAGVSTTEQHATLTFYVNPQSRNYFISLLSLAKQQHQNYNFPVL